MKKNILILSFTNPNHDPRVLRQIQYFMQYYQVIVAGLEQPNTFNGIKYIRIVRKSKYSIGEAFRALCLLFGINIFAQKRFFFHDGLPVQHFDFVICNDVEPLPLAFSIAKGAPVLFDAHEYYPLEFENSWRWRIFMKRYLTELCKKYIPCCAAMTTVSKGIANRYAEEFGLLPEVVYSGPSFHVLKPSQVDPENIRLVHHGIASQERGIEHMIEMVRLLDKRFSLDFYLVGDNAYIETLKKRSADVSCIRWNSPLPMQDLTIGLTSYDIGLYLLKPETFNLKYCLPNKFFEFIQARLAIAIGPSPEMASLVQEHNLGVIADDFTPHAMASCLNALTYKDVIFLKENVDKAAVKLHADFEMHKIHGIVRRFLGV